MASFFQNASSERVVGSSDGRVASSERALGASEGRVASSQNGLEAPENALFGKGETRMAVKTRDPRVCCTKWVSKGV